MKSPLFIKILVSSLIPAISVIALMTLIVTFLITGFVRDISLLQNESFNRNAAYGLERLLEDAYSSVSLLSKNGIPENISNEDKMHETFANLIISHPVLEKVWVVYNDDNGKNVCGSYQKSDNIGKILNFTPLTREAILSNLSSEWYKIPATANQPFSSALFRSPEHENSKFSSIFSFPIIRDGENIGVLCATLGYKNLFDYEKSFDISYVEQLNDVSKNSVKSTNKIENQRREVFIINSYGDILFSENPLYSDENLLLDIQKRHANNALHKLLLEKLNDDSNNTILHTPFSAEYYSNYMVERSILTISEIHIKNSEQKIYLATDISIETMYIPASNFTIANILASLLGMIILVVFVYISARDVVNPIRELIRLNVKLAESLEITPEMFEREIAEIDFDRSNKKRRDEISDLRMALQKMASKLVSSRKYEVQLLENEIEKQKLIASSEAKTRFFANMSHEIRTPMNSVLGIAQILLTERVGSLTCEQKNYIENIKTSGEGLLGIINDILDLSKLESGKMALSPTDFNFEPYIDRIASIIEFMARSKNLDFIFEKKGEIPKFIFGDETRLRQIILNIASNGVKFTTKGHIKFTITVEEKILKFEICDTGRGISESNKKNLFQAFEQFGDQSEFSKSGTGLGLSISKHLASLMNGNIDVESELGKGSTFIVVLPRDVLKDGNPEKVKLYEEKLRIIETEFNTDSNILIVDDNDVNLEVAKGLIFAVSNGDKLKIDTAGSGYEAIRKIKQNNYDLVFMDHMMPEKDGIQTVKELREDGFTELIIIALTANAVIGAKEILLKAGMNDFISKPINKNELVSMLVKWLPKMKKTENTHKILDSLQEESENSSILFPEYIGEIKTIDGIRGIGGNLETYSRTLKILSKKITELIELLPENIKTGNYENFGVLVHGLKSSLAYVGANDFSKFSSNLETAARNKNHQICDDSLDDFILRLENLKISLDEYFEKSIITPPLKENTNPENTDILCEIINKIETSIDDFDVETLFETAKQLEEIHKPENTKSLFDQLQEKISAFNYQDAKNIIKEIKKLTL